VTVATIVMPEGAFDDELDAVETFCWLMDTALSREAFWSPDGADEAQNLYHALLYDGTVNNGGHAQFVANRDNRTSIFISALNGLNLIGAQPYESIVEALIAWTEGHPDEATRIMDPIRPSMFRPPQLAQLDDLFFVASDERTIRSFAYDWLCRSPKVRVISKDEFHEIIRRNEASKPA
jgi:hypothetical protein